MRLDWRWLALSGVPLIAAVVWLMRLRRPVMLGAVTALLPRLERGRLEATVQGREGLTPFARWAGTWGLMPLGMLCGALVLVLGALRHLGRRGGRTRRR